MDINIEKTATYVKIGDEIFIRDLIASSLKQNQPQVQAVNVSVREIPGFDLECFNQCIVEVILTNDRIITEDSMAGDLPSAIQRAAQRAASAVARASEGYPGLAAPGRFGGAGETRQ